MPLFGKRNAQPKQVPDAVNRRYIADISDGIRDTKLGAAERIVPAIQQQYGRDEIWSRDVTGATVSLLFGDEPVQPSQFIQENWPALQQAVHLVHSDAELLGMLAMAVREKVLMCGGMIPMLPEDVRLRFVEWAQLRSNPGEEAVAALEAMERHGLPSIGKISAPGVFKRDAAKFAQRVMRRVQSSYVGGSAVPLFGKQKDAAAGLPSAKDLREWENGVPLLKVTMCERLLPKMLAKYRADQNWSISFVALVVATAFGEPPVNAEQQALMDRHSNIVYQEVTSLVSDKDIMYHLEYAVRANAAVLQAAGSPIHPTVYANVIELQRLFGWKFDKSVPTGWSFRYGVALFWETTKTLTTR